MKTTQINKLVRDKIPEIIEKSGKRCTTRILDDEEYFTCLTDKLKEETAEFLLEAQRGNDEAALKELCDVEEVIHSLVEAIGVTLENFDRISQTKKAERGGFEKQIFLEEIIEED